MTNKQILAISGFISLVFIISSYAIDVTILPDSIRQTVDGAGHCHEGDRMNGDNYIIDSKIQQMIDNHIQIFRDMFPNRSWEPNNDNNDPFAINMAGFATNDARCTNCLQRLKKMQDLGVYTILGVWDLPTWMKSGNTIGNMDEAVETLVSFLLYGKQKYNLDVDYVDFNESGTGVNIKLSTAQYADFIKRFAVQCQKNGLKTRASIASCLVYEQSYIQGIWADTAARSAGGYPTFHSYEWPYGSTDFTNWGDFRKTINKNLWCTETDYDWAYYNNSDRNTWVGAREQARNYWSCYYLARASTTAGWYWYPDLPSGKVVISYMQQFDHGGQIMECTQTSTLMTIAYKHPVNGKFVLIVLNTATSEQDVTFINVPNNATFTLTRTANNGDRAKSIGSSASAGTRFTVPILAESFNTFVYSGPVQIADRNVFSSKSMIGSRFIISVRNRMIDISSKYMSEARVKVVTLSGQIIETGNISSSSSGFLTRAIPAGVYCLKIEDASGIMTSRVLIK